MSNERVRITHNKTDELLADGPLGWGITYFEGNYYISGKYLKTKNFTLSFFPGICPYKFIYVWTDYNFDDTYTENHLGFRYIIPNPLFPFIIFRLALPGHHPSLTVEVYKN